MMSILRGFVLSQMPSLNLRTQRRVVYIRGICIFELVYDMDVICRRILAPQWPSGLERWTGDRVVLRANRAAATSLRNFGNSVYPALPGLSEETLNRWSLLSGVYARGSKICHTGGIPCRGIHHS